MLWIILIGIVAATAIGVSMRRRSHDDVHSVEGYHRQLHTLEVMRGHTAEAEGSAGLGTADPEPAFRVSTHTTVRLTEPGKPAIPPIPPPLVADPDHPITFDDAGTVISTPTTTPGSDWREDKAMHGIDRRPRRLAAPAAAVAAVTVLIVLLLVTGNHKVPPRHGPKAVTTSTHQTHHSSTATTIAKRTHQPTHHHAAVTTTTVPVVSLPHSGSAQSAVYAVRPVTYTLAMSATTSQCWVSVTQAGSGTVLFTGVLNPTQTQTLTVTGAAALVVGAPNAFAANIDGTAVSFPFGYQAPFTMQFLPAGSSQS